MAVSLLSPRRVLVRSCMWSYTGQLSSDPALAALSLVAGFQSPRLALFWTALVIASSVPLWLLLRAKGWGRAAAWISFAFAAQACSLQLLWVGPEIRLQLFYAWRALLKSHQVAFLLPLLVEILVVFWALKTRRAQFAMLLRKTIALPGLAVLIAVECYAAATIEPGVARALVSGGFLHEAVMHATKIGLGVLVLAMGTAITGLAAASIPETHWAAIVSWWRRLDRRVLPWICAIWVVVVSSLLAWAALDRMPHVPDEFGYLFQAKYFATGRLYLPAPEDANAFAIPFQLVDGTKSYNVVPPGWPAVLALGVRAGVPWLVNPLLGGIAILLAYAFIRRIYDDDIAAGSVLLLSVSPWLLFLSASFMPHALALMCALLALLAVSHARETGSIPWAGVAGLSVGLLLHVRSLEAVIVAIVAGVWWLSAGWRKLRFAAVVSTCIVGVTMIGLYAAYDKALTGNPLQLPMNKFLDQTYYKGADRLGFGRNVGNFGWTGLDALPGHGPVDVVMNTNQNLYLANFEPFGWACGSLLFVFLLLIRGSLRKDILMWGLMFAVWCGLSLYWFSGGPDFGPRYWYLMVLPIAVLSIRGAQLLASQWGESVSPLAGQRVWAFVALASALGFLNLVPWRALDKYHNYRGVRADIRRMDAHYDFSRSLVLVRGPAFPDYASAVPFNPPALDPDSPGPIFARDLNQDSTRALLNDYRDRPVWLIVGPGVTRAGFKVIAGPISPEQAKEMELSQNYGAVR